MTSDKLSLGKISPHSLFSKAEFGKPALKKKKKKIGIGQIWVGRAQATEDFFFLALGKFGSPCTDQIDCDRFCEL